jgi:hypothetical protein
MHTGFWWTDLKERNDLENLDLEGRIILKWILKNWDEETLTEFIRLNTGIGDGNL